VLLLHLGMSGRMVLGGPGDGPPDRHDHFILETDDGAVVRFNDARRFGHIDLVEPGGLDSHPLLQALGPEPLGNAFSGPVLAEALRGKATPIKAALLDQRVVAGLGNIYVSESLFWAGISPRRLARTVHGRAGRAAGGGDPPRAARGDRRRRLQPARLCPGLWRARLFPAPLRRLRPPGPSPARAATATWRGRGIRRIVQAGRSTFYCPRRQR
jgi:formamidopyrimidine-DNA glycosylase